MSEIVAIAANASSCENNGGVSHAYAINADKISAVTVASGVITGFTIDGVGETFERLSFDDQDNVAFFNEEPNQVGGTIEMNGTSLMQFNGISQAKITAANKAKACCGVVVIWVQYDGTRRVQGIDVDTSDNWEFSKTKARISPTLNSGTGAETSVMQYAVAHVGRFASATTDLDDAAIEAITGA